MKRSIHSWFKGKRSKKPKKSLFNIDKSTYDFWTNPTIVGKSGLFSLKRVHAVLEEAVRKGLNEAEDVYAPVHPNSIAGKELKKREKRKKS